jgi:hypothetical protein
VEPARACPPRALAIMNERLSRSRLTRSSVAISRIPISHCRIQTSVSARSSPRSW